MKKTTSQIERPFKLIEVWGQSPDAWALIEPEVKRLKADGYKQVSNWKEGNTHVLKWVKFN